MISVKMSEMSINGIDTIEQNILPKLREVPFDKELIDTGLLENELEGFGYMTGDRYLPCRMQDGYSRDKSLIEVDVIEFENDVVKVLILPKHGGRVWSLYNKKNEREILFRNPVLQPGNLGVRNAWLSGGIEWNLGQFGHSSFTMEHVYAATVRAENGREFIRLYEYERIKGLFFQVDLHLYEGDENLYAHVTILNRHDEERSLYWWTNIAVELNRDCRVVSGTENVIATTPVDNVNTFGHATLPYLPSMPDKDGTFPENFPFSSEYFFQNEKDIRSTWEVAAYNDGTAFFERSTPELAYKKMFCWSNEQGGHHWQHFLATDDAPLYVELQAGVIPSQVHGGKIAGKSSVSFTQVFGSADIDSEKAHESEYKDCVRYCHEVVENKVSADSLLEKNKECAMLSECPIDRELYTGSGYALLEEARVTGFIPKSMSFVYTDWEYAREWECLLVGETPEMPEGYANAYMTDSIWLPYLEKAASQPKGTGKFFYGIALFENGQFEQALQNLKGYAEVSKEPIAYRTIGYAYSRLSNQKNAVEWFDKAFEDATKLNADYYEEYLKYLVEIEEYEKAWALYANATKEIQDADNVKLRAIGAAIECGEMEFAQEIFKVEQTNIREGEAVLNEHWVRMQELLFVKEGVNPLEAKKKAELLSLPYIVDFRLN